MITVTRFKGAEMITLKGKYIKSKDYEDGLWHGFWGGVITMTVLLIVVIIIAEYLKLF